MMKKILLSTVMIVATAGVAAAEVKLSGSGRFGIVNVDNAATGFANTVISSRLRFNVDASTTTDGGVVFGGRIRFQNSTGQTTSPFSPAMLYVESNGVRVEVGNTNTAYDSVALMYNPELGYRGTSFGDPQGSYYSFNSGPYASAVAAVVDDPLTPVDETAAAIPGEANRVGIYIAYSIAGLNLKASYVQPDQTLSGSSNDESSVAVDYTTGAFTVAAAGSWNANGINNNDIYFVGAAYAFNDVGNVGINFNDNGAFNTTTLYGNYKFDAITVGAYVTDSDLAGDDTAYGLGASYDLGGATLAGSIQSGFNSEVVTDLGVSMSF